MDVRRGVWGVSEFHQAWLNLVRGSNDHPVQVVCANGALPDGKDPAPVFAKQAQRSV